MSNITNLNRDYLIKINVKQSTIDVPKMTFWNTDKKTSNMFVQLVINMSTNELISQYVTVQNATDYKITLNVIKPKTKQYKTIEATLLNEEKALFEIDLPDEFTDQVGDYSFEFEVSSKVDSNDESITTSNGTYKVNGSILTNLNEETSSSPDLPILKQLIEQVKSLQGGDLTGYQKKNDAAQKTIVEDGKLYLTKLDGTKLDDGTTLPTGSGTSIDDTNTTTDKTWSSSKIDSQFKDIVAKIGNISIEGSTVYIGSEQPTNGALYWLDTSKNSSGGSSGGDSGGGSTGGDEWTYDNSKWIEGYMLEWGTGEKIEADTSQPNYTHTYLYDEFIPVYGKSTITFTNNAISEASATRFAGVAWYDENKNFKKWGNIYICKTEEITINSAYHYARYCTWSQSVIEMDYNIEVI